MSKGLRINKELLLSWRLPIFIVLSLALGGTSQNILFPKLVLLVFAIGIIAEMLMSERSLELYRLRKWPIYMGLSFLFIFLLYLIPLPPSVWSDLPNRELISEGFELIGAKKPWLPLSVTPEDTYLTFWYFLPPIAVVLIMALDLTQRELQRTVLAVLAFGFASILLAIVQVMSMSRGLYLYKISNFNHPTGFFSNTNHFATFLCMLVPLVFYLSSTLPNKMMSRKVIRIISGFFLLLSVSLIVLSDSRAGYIVLIGVILISLWTLRDKASRWFKYVSIFLFAVTLLFLADFFLLGANAENLLKEFGNNGNGSSRLYAMSTIWSNVELYSIFGTGPGSFYDVFLTIDDRELLGTSYMNQAHNDYLQLWMEMGVIGLFFMVVIFLTSVYHVVKIVLLRSKTTLANFASISVFAIMVASLVDYPLRTIGLATLFTFFAMLMFRLDKGHTDQV